MRNKAYRRHMHEVHDRAWRRIINQAGYNPYRGYIMKDLVRDEDGVWDWVEADYITECSRNRKVRFYKKLSNRKVRRYKDTLQNNNYKKVFELWWTLF